MTDHKPECPPEEYAMYLSNSYMKVYADLTLLCTQVQM